MNKILLLLVVSTFSFAGTITGQKGKGDGRVICGTPVGKKGSGDGYIVAGTVTSKKGSGDGLFEVS
jgi:hypothetical protein